MTMDFTAKFTRYGNGLRQISADHRMHAENFRVAADKADDFVRAMQQADPSRTYAVASVACEGYFGGVQCEDVMTIWGDPFPAKVSS